MSSPKELAEKLRARSAELVSNYMRCPPKLIELYKVKEGCCLGYAEARQNGSDVVQIVIPTDKAHNICAALIFLVEAIEAEIAEHAAAAENN